MPACALAFLNTLAGVAGTVMALISLNWIAAAVSAAEAGMSVYYFLGVYTVYRSMPEMPSNQGFWNAIWDSRWRLAKKYNAGYKASKIYLMKEKNRFQAY